MCNTLWIHITLILCVELPDTSSPFQKQLTYCCIFSYKSYYYSHTVLIVSTTFPFIQSTLKNTTALWLHYVSEFFIMIATQLIFHNLANNFFLFSFEEFILKIGNHDDKVNNKKNDYQLSHPL